MDITEFTEQQGNFLKAEMIEGEQVVSITNEATIVLNKKYDTERLHVPIKFEDKEFIFDCSKTNARTISQILGKDTSQWLNKELVLEKYKTKTSSGEMVNAINVKEVRI